MVSATFDPEIGHEQSGRRPALVLTPRVYNEKAGLAVTCPITSRIKGYPFEIPVVSARVQGVVLADQIRSMDWRVRQFTLIERAHADLVQAVQQSLGALLRLG